MSRKFLKKKIYASFYLNLNLFFSLRSSLFLSSFRGSKFLQRMSLISARIIWWAFVLFLLWLCAVVVFFFECARLSVQSFWKNLQFKSHIFIENDVFRIDGKEDKTRPKMMMMKKKNRRWRKKGDCDFTRLMLQRRIIMTIGDFFFRFFSFAFKVGNRQVNLL